MMIVADEIKAHLKMVQVLNSRAQISRKVEVCHFG